MTRASRLLILLFIMIGLIIAMMQCAHKSMHKRKKTAQHSNAEQSLHFKSTFDIQSI